MFHYVYVLECLSKSRKQFYVGYCSDLQKRIKRHLNKDVKATKRFDKITLVYYEACLNKVDARKREDQLKTGFGRGYLKRRLGTYLNAGIVQR